LSPSLDFKNQKIGILSHTDENPANLHRVIEIRHSSVYPPTKFTFDVFAQTFALASKREQEKCYFYNKTKYYQPKKPTNIS